MTSPRKWIYKTLVSIHLTSSDFYISLSSSTSSPFQSSIVREPLSVQHVADDKFTTLPRDALGLFVAFVLVIRWLPCQSGQPHHHGNSWQTCSAVHLDILSVQHRPTWCCREVSVRYKIKTSQYVNVAILIQSTTEPIKGLRIIIYKKCL